MLRHIAVVLVIFVATTLGFSAGQTKVPSISADRGECTADFTVTDTKMTPIFNADVHVQVRWGIGGIHRTDLDVGTNSEGKARFEGLPAEPKRPLEFTASYQGRKTTVLVDPRDKCHGSYPVVLPNEPLPASSDTDKKQ